ncbi:MAG TPA: peptidoglycan bridge formation glycyltransferase FemA/FemB family protein [Armatimonadota bacterium]|nr:peptidoglycan bridge formation glycyltransferase FemA/FemB family protein [Armatimonadota bacterium]
MIVREMNDPAARQEWNRFVGSLPSASFLQSWEWGELKSRSGWKPIRLMVSDDARPIAAISILTRRMKDLLKENLHIPLPVPDAAIAYAPHGPVVSFEQPEAVTAVLDAASQSARRQGAFVLKVEPTVEEEIVRVQLEKHGFQRSSASEGFGGTQPRCVMQLSLIPDIDALLAGCKQKTRYNLRLAERKGVTVRQGQGTEDLRTFYNLLRVTADRDRFQVRGFDYYEDMQGILGGAGMMKLFLAEHEGEALSGAILVTFGARCVYLYGASSNEKRQLMPNYLMQWEMIRWARASGFEIYDFRGVSPHKDAHKDTSGDDHLAGLNRFKEGFGAVFVEYVGDYDRVLNPLWNMAWSQGMPRLRAMLKRRTKDGGRRAEDEG